MNNGNESPKHWEKKTFKDVLDVLKDGTHFSPKSFGGKNLYITSKNIRMGGLDLGNVNYIPDDEHQRIYSACPVRFGDVLLTKDGANTGNVCINTLKEEFSLLSSVAYLRGKAALLINEYLLQWLSNPRVQFDIKNDMTGQAITRLTLQKIGNFKILLPPLPEQKAIADLLSTWDEAIEKTERLIQAKEKRLNAYGREVFYSNRSGKVGGQLSVRLKDVLLEHGDKSTGNEEVYSVSVHKGLVNQIEHLGRSFSAANTDNYNCVHYGDIVYTKSPTGDFPLGIVKQSYSTKNVIVSPLYGVFSPKSFHLGVVINFYFSSPERTKNYLFPIIQKGAKNTIAITNKTFLSSKLHLPIDEAAQKMIAEYVSAARDEIDMLKQLREKYKSQKRGLMQKILTGAWRMKTEIINQYLET